MLRKLTLKNTDTEEITRLCSVESCVNRYVNYRVGGELTVRRSET